MVFNALFGMLFGWGFWFSGIIFLRIIFGLLGLATALVAILASHVVEIENFPVEIKYDGIWLIVIGVIGLITCGYLLGPWLVIIAGILFLAWQE
jgi:hypothetical protein